MSYDDEYTGLEYMGFDYSRREALILITAGKGDAREVIGIVGRCLRSTLGVRRWGDPPYDIERQAVRDPYNNYGRPLYRLHIRDGEMSELQLCIDRECREAGWGRGSLGLVDIYHD